MFPLSTSFSLSFFQIASRLKSSDSSSSASGVKRPYGDFGDDEPGSKKMTLEDGAAGEMDGGAAAAGGAATDLLMIPNKMVGLVIGRGGEQINRLQAETGAKIQMQQEQPGSAERQCTLMGAPYSIQKAREAIEAIISSEVAGAGTSSRGFGGAGVYEMMIPCNRVGLVIGKGGEIIKHLQEQSGAKIVIIQESKEADRDKPLRITGTEQQQEVAKRMVTDILSQAEERDMGFGGRGRGRGGPGGGMRGGRGGFRGGRGGGFGGNGWEGGGGEYGAGAHQDYILVPANKCGLIIGKGGETIKMINSTSGAHCEIDKNAPPNAMEKNFVIRGSPESVERAKQMILEKLGGDLGYSGGGGGGGTWGGGGGRDGYQQQNPYNSAAASAGVAINPQTGQPDYSSQWADYYRSMGMTREAEAIEAARGGGGGGGAPAGPPGGAPGAAGVPQQPQPGGPGAPGGADYSAQWAEYYRSTGRIKEAEAIEAQMKQKPVGSLLCCNVGFRLICCHFFRGPERHRLLHQRQPTLSNLLDTTAIVRNTFCYGSSRVYCY